MPTTAQTLLATAYAAGYDALSERSLNESVAAAVCEGGAWIATVNTIDFVHPDSIGLDGWSLATDTLTLYKWHGAEEDRANYCAVTTGSRVWFTANGELAVPSWVDLGAKYYVGSVVDHDTYWTFKLYTTLEDARLETNAVDLTTDSDYRMYLHLEPNI
jgi:hypothetical protein